MNKIKLEIVGLSYSETQSGAYALLLAEAGGKRRLPIVIGGFEAQAIAIELEKMVPTRPLTHDLFKTFATTFNVSVKEIFIYDLVEGVFFSKIICEKDGDYYEIDARTSDAIAIGVRFNSPIYTLENILYSAGILLEEENEELPPATSSDESAVTATPTSQNDLFKNLSIEELQKKLDEAISNEEYELASKIRDEMNKRSSN
ncbi:MAG: bifunctional nuclease family protein [Crocinitomicaceae bacterium]|nr:bifunctional nuclease family protein [Crocinitomicaceae bacterium]